MLAFLGMGLLGGNFVRALRRRGEEVQVWNRTSAKAEALTEIGARAFTDPADAVRSAERVHMTLSDDDAVDDVLARARPGLREGAIIVDHTTTSASGVVRRVATWKERGIHYVHAPVFMGPANARDSTGMMLVSGEASLVARLRPSLAKMTGTVFVLGERVDAAAAYKLMGNLYLMFLTTGLADMFALGRALGVTPEQASSLFDYFNPGVAIAVRAKRMTEGDFSDPSWELQMATKDARLMLEEADRAGVKLETLPTIFARMKELVAQGHGADDWTVLGKDSVGR